MIRITLASIVLIFALLPAPAVAQNKPALPTYAAAYPKSIDSGKPLVIFVGIKGRPISGLLTCEVDELGSYPPGIVFGIPAVDAVNFRTTLPANATDAQIRAALGEVNPAAVVEDALGEVNAARAQRGLPPFIPDEELTKAALSAATFRAARQMAGHTANDFAHLPAGSSADAAGCAAWEPSSGWGACCTFESWRYAGAAWVMGSDGKRYMHLFVRR